MRVDFKWCGVYNKNMITLSKRMEAIASMITPGGVLADVGTDHGYIPIYQVQLHRNPYAVAMDLRKGPLERAAEHIRQSGLTGQIKTRLSDGVAALEPGEADSIVVAGMGGELILHILSEGEAVCRQAKELILQPQSEIAAVRRYLREHGYYVDAENMVFEDGKYYPMMRAQKRQAKTEEVMKCDGPEEELQLEQELRYGPQLLWNKHPLLEGYLEREETLYRNVLDSLSGKNTEGAAARRAEVEHELFLIDKVRRNLSKPSVLYHSHLA